MRPKMRHLFLALAISLCPLASSQAQVSIGIGLPSVSIGVNFAAYPELVPIPGYPVYYDPRANYNYFFYDGLYWAFWNDNWYASSWYNGPWQLVDPYNVPLFVLRIPVRYYHVRPAYFGGWALDAPPHWGDHWGRSWEQRRVGWDRWNRAAVPAPAPLPLYQRQYSGNRYPREIAQQQTIRTQNYHYQPRDAVARQTFQQQGAPNDQRRARAEPQAPTQQQRSTQQSRAVQNQQSQAIQAERAQASRERQAVQSEQMHRGPSGPQGNAETRAATQAQGRAQGQGQGRGPAQAQENRAPQSRAVENRPPAQAQARVENRGAPQGHEENRGGGQERAAENNKGARQGNVKEDKKE